MKKDLKTTKNEDYILKQGEEEIASFNQSWVAYAKEAIILCFAIVWLICLLNGFSKSSFFDWLQCVILCFIVWYEISSIRRKLWFSITLTNQRIIFQGVNMQPFSGYIFYHSIDKIVDTTYFFEKLLKTGRVYIKTIGKDYTFKNLKEKDKFIQMVQAQEKSTRQ